MVAVAIEALHGDTVPAVRHIVEVLAEVEIGTVPALECEVHVIVVASPNTAIVELADPC